MKALLLCLFVPFFAQAEEALNPVLSSETSVQDRSVSMSQKTNEAASDPDADLKQWFADVMWQKFILERDPRLEQTPVTREELQDFIENAQRSGTPATLTMDDLTRLVKFREKGCESKPEAWGLDLQKGFQWD